MCMIKENLVNNEKEVKQTNIAANTDQNDQWSQLFRKSLKPKLSRKIVTSAKLNLNRYWNKFEELLNKNDSTEKPYRNNYNSTTYCLLPMVNRSQTTPPRIAKKSILKNRVAPLVEPTAIPIQIDQNNIQDEINTFMSKKFVVEKNFARSSMYKHFNDEALYHGVNLNLPRQRCSCSVLPPLSPKYQFSHRNIQQLSCEDKENLENEATEGMYINYGYDISF